MKKKRKLLIAAPIITLVATFGILTVVTTSDTDHKSQKSTSSETERSAKELDVPENSAQPVNEEQVNKPTIAPVANTQTQATPEPSAETKDSVKASYGWNPQNIECVNLIEVGSPQLFDTLDKAKSTYKYLAEKWVSPCAAYGQVYKANPAKFEAMKVNNGY